MINEEYVKELEADNEKLLKQVELRDKLLHIVLKGVCGEDICNSCAIKAICVSGAKVEVCVAGMLLALDECQKEDLRAINSRQRERSSDGH